MIVNEVKGISDIVINMTDNISEKNDDFQDDIFDKIASTLNMLDHIGEQVQYGGFSLIKKSLK